MWRKLLWRLGIDSDNVLQSYSNTMSVHNSFTRTMVVRGIFKHSADFFMQHIAFYLEGISFVHKYNQVTLWTAKLWKSHENVIKKPRKHFSGHWIWRFHFHGLFCMPWIFYKKAVMNFHGSWNCHEISADGFMTLEKAGVL